MNTPQPGQAHGSPGPRCPTSLLGAGCIRRSPQRTSRLPVCTDHTNTRVPPHKDLGTCLLKGVSPHLSIHPTYLAPACCECKRSQVFQKQKEKKKFPECSSSQADHLATLCRENSYLKFTRVRNLEPSQKSRHTGTTLPRSGGCCGQDTTPLHEQCPSQGVRHAPITEGSLSDHGLPVTVSG